MKSILVITVTLAISIAGYAQQASGMLNKYLLLKEALVNSDNKAVAGYAVSFQKEIEATPSFSEKEHLLNAVRKLIKAGDIERQRIVFAEVSPIFWKVLKSASLAQDVYYQYCPMKKFYWVSGEAAIKNPYYGAAMPGCGSVVDKRLQ